MTTFNEWRDRVFAKTNPEDMEEVKNLIREYYNLIKICALMSPSKNPDVMKRREEKLERKKEVRDRIKEITGVD